MVNYYRDMWPHWSHILAPLTAKTGTPMKAETTPPFQWTADMQKEFDQMKALMAAVCYVHTLITIILSISSRMHLITNLAHTSYKKANLLHIAAKNLMVHR